MDGAPRYSLGNYSRKLAARALRASLRYRLYLNRVQMFATGRFESDLGRQTARTSLCRARRACYRNLKCSIFERGFNQRYFNGCQRSLLGCGADEYHGGCRGISIHRTITPVQPSFFILHPATPGRWPSNMSCITKFSPNLCYPRGVSTGPRRYAHTREFKEAEKKFSAAERGEGIAEAFVIVMFARIYRCKAGNSRRAAEPRKLNRPLRGHVHCRNHGTWLSSAHAVK